MKIAHLTFSPQFVQGVCVLLRGLQKRGHEIKVFTTHKLPEDANNTYLLGFNIVVEPWSWFDFTSLEKFDPDLIIMWNGYAPWTYAAMKHLKNQYPMLHVERGWLPQKDNYYIADDLAAHSKFIMNVPHDFPVDKEKISALKKLYRPRYADYRLPDTFIFIPAQLDEDTSITISSPLYKTCDSFIGHVFSQVPDVPIIVKNHPLLANKQRLSKITLYDGPLSSLDLVAQATVVAGLTSTVLAEALVYDKPVISFGLNVAMRSHIHGLAEGFGTLKDICKGVPYAPLHSRDQTLSWLLSKQWPSMNPPEWVYEYIEQKG